KAVSAYAVYLLLKSNQHFLMFVQHEKSYRPNSQLELARCKAYLYHFLHNLIESATYSPPFIYVSISSHFLLGDNCLIIYSRFIAVVFDSSASSYRNFKGPRPRVYFAPLPDSCFFNRAVISVVYPVSKQLSFYSNIYT